MFCLTSPHFHSSSLQITPSPLRTLTTDHTVIIIVQYTGHWFWFTAALNSSQPFPNLTWCTRPACRATITQRRVAAVHSHFHYRRRILLCRLTKRVITLPSTRFVFYLTWVATTTAWEQAKARSDKTQVFTVLWYNRAHSSVSLCLHRKIVAWDVSGSLFFYFSLPHYFQCSLSLSLPHSPNMSTCFFHHAAVEETGLPQRPHREKRGASSLCVSVSLHISEYTVTLLPFINPSRWSRFRAKDKI